LSCGNTKTSLHKEIV
jgi:regulator of chromosome condensation